MCEKAFVTKQLLILAIRMITLHASLTNQNIDVLFFITRTCKMSLIFQKLDMLIRLECLNNWQILTVPKMFFNLLHDPNSIINSVRTTKVMKKENRQLKVPITLGISNLLPFLYLISDATSTSDLALPFVINELINKINNVLAKYKHDSLFIWWVAFVDLYSQISHF